MNANTACAINDAVDQAIRCGETVDDVIGQVQKALKVAFDAKQADDREAFRRRMEQARL